MDSFFDTLTNGAVTAIVAAVLMTVLAGGAAFLTRNWGRSGKVWAKGDDGHTCLSPFVLLLGLLCAAMAVACLVLGLIDPPSLQDSGQFTAWLGLIGGFSLAALLILPHSRQAWDWDDKGLRWRGPWRAVSIPWSDIKSAGKTWTGQTFVANASGARICWSSYTLEHQTLRDAVARRRPDLTVPAA